MKSTKQKSNKQTYSFLCRGIQYGKGWFRCRQTGKVENLEIANTDVMSLDAKKHFSGPSA